MTVVVVLVFTLDLPSQRVTAVPCRACNGTGCKEISYKPFVKRKRKRVDRYGRTIKHVLDTDAPWLCRTEKEEKESKVPIVEWVQKHRRKAGCMKTIRDSQRSKLYKAEGQVKNLKARERLETVPEMQTWVDQIVGSQWWLNYRVPAVDPTIRQYVGIQDYGPPQHRTIRVDDGRGRRCAHGYSHGVIALPRWCRTRMMVLHEVAHTIQMEEPAHGRHYARIYLDLFRRWLGKAAYLELKAAFKAGRVRFSKRRIKHVSKEQREALVKLLQFARDLKKQKSLDTKAAGMVP